MKYLHIMNYSNYVVSKSFVRFVGDFFNNKDHVFAFVGEFDSKFEELSSQCEIIHLKRREELIPYMKEAELVLLHALTFNAKMQIISLLQPSIMRKIVWIAWGGDLYKGKTVSGLKKLISKTIKELFVLKLPFLVSIFDPDIKYFKENYNSKAKVLTASYVGGLYMELYKKTFDYIDLKEKYDRGETINIVVGHQADPALNHISILKQLYAYKDKNIKIYIPLNYGDQTNAKNVEECAKQLFGDKAIALREWIAPDKYDEFLNNMDIAVFDVDRQIALGNINKLIYMNKKIFMRPGTVMHDYYKSNNVPIYDSTAIGKIGFEEFIVNKKDDTGVEVVKNRVSDRDRKIKEWENVFSLIKEKK